MNYWKVFGGSILVVLALAGLILQVFDIYNWCYNTSFPKIGPSIFTCSYYVEGFQRNLVLTVPLLALGSWLLVFGFKELSLRTFKKESRQAVS
jgi:hypothetical protein